MEQTLFIPRWFYDKNLGDSIVATCLPKVIKHKHPDCKLSVVTSGEMLEIFNDLPEVDKVYLPNQEILSIPADKWSDKTIKYSVFPKESAEYFNFWNARYDYLSNHPTINKLVVNYLLQNELEYAIDLALDFAPKLTPKKLEVEKELLSGKFVFAIVPEKKIANRNEPHPSCNGIGYRFNGDEGESWRNLVVALKEEYPNSIILEVTEEELKFGDIKTHARSIKELAYYATLVNLAITVDGGMHHVFNSQNIPVILLDAWHMAKPDLFKLKNAIPIRTPECVKNCSKELRKITDWEDTAKFCDRSCCNLRTITIIEGIKEYVQ